MNPQDSGILEANSYLVVLQARAKTIKSTLVNVVKSRASAWFLVKIVEESVAKQRDGWLSREIGG